MSTLDQWQSEAIALKMSIDSGESYSILVQEQNDQILALIDLVRSKDAALREINDQAHAHEGCLSYKWLQQESKEALLLTEKLK